MISAAEALQAVLDAARPLPGEERAMLESVGLVLAERVAADRDQPPFDRAMMDGFAVPPDAAGRRLPNVAQLAAGHTEAARLDAGQCMEIMTGAACPPGAVAVVPREEVRHEQGEAVLPPRIVVGQHIAPQGSERRAGETVLREGQKVDALAVGVLACFGRTTVRVVRPAKVAIVTTGAELVAPDAEPGPSQIRDSNGPMLAALARAITGERPLVERAADRMDAVTDSIRRLGEADVLVMAGGVSAGSFDFVPDALRQQGAEIVFHKVRQKPGKPLLFARRGDQLIFGLPGNPLACHFCFHRYVGPAIRKMQGLEPARRVLRGLLAAPVAPKPGRAYYLLGTVDDAPPGGSLPTIRPMPAKTSADLFAAVSPNCYLELPAGRAKLSAGECVSFTRLDGR